MKRHRFVVFLACWTPLFIVGVACGQLGFSFSSNSDDEYAGDIIPVFKIGPLVETPQNVPPMFGDEPMQSTKSLIERLKKAKLDDNVKAIVLDLEGAGLGVGQLEEIYKEISCFKAVEKSVYVHVDSLQTGSYALASAASHISVTPTGDIWLVGLYGEAPYLRGMLDKIGVVPDFERCGDYKSAVETMMRSEPSEESQEMTDWLLDSLYETIVDMIAEGRGFKASKVLNLIDEGPYNAKQAYELGLIDSVKHRQDFIADIKSRHGSEVAFVLDYAKEDPLGDIPEDFFGAMNFFMQLLHPTPKEYTDPSIAIVYVEGMIVTGAAQSSPFGGTSSGAYSTTIRKALDKAAEDDTVKAVVLRVDSGGGSALASEIILEASRRVAARKPLIVSMGNVAGSGGYYVTCAADTVFADKATITGSIGVLAGKLVTTGGWDKLGINWHANQRGKMAGMLSSATKFSDSERAKMRGYIDEVYDEFTGHVVKARGDKLAKPIKELAGGRVYTGVQALELGLVDKLGGLSDAVKFAADKANMSDYMMRVIPEPANFFDMLANDLHTDEYTMTLMPRPQTLVDTPLFQTLLPALRHVDPYRASSIEWSLKCLSLMDREGVVMAMPTMHVIR